MHPSGLSRPLRRALVATTAACLAATTLSALPPATAQESDPGTDSSQTVPPNSGTGSTPSQSPSPSQSPEPSPDVGDPPAPESPDSQVSPSDSPSETPDPSQEPSATPSESPSPSISPTLQEEDTGSLTERIVRVESPEDIDRLTAEVPEIGGEVLATYESAINGFSARLSPKDALYLAEQPGVLGIEQSQEFTLQATAVRSDSFCTDNSIGKIDDGSTLGISLGFDVNWYGVTYDEILINNNGGASFNDGAGRFDYWSGINLDTTDRPLVLPLFTDIDTRNAGASAVTYGTGTIDGKKAFCVNWVDVGEFYQSAPKFSFQLVIVDQSAAGNAGDVDIEFNYDEVGTPTSDTNGKFVVGYAVPHSRTDSLVRVTSSDDPSMYADGGALSLVTNRYPTSGSTPGRYTFEVRPDAGGTPPESDPTPTPISAAGNCDGQNNPSTTLGGYSYTYCNVEWSLDRIDQRVSTLNDEFSPEGDGADVNAYVVDTGLNSSHQDFTGRIGTGRNFYGTDADGDTSTDDCNGHGTHVASSLAGSTYGVAKKATVIPIRVFGCSGSTSTVTIVNALEWIAANHPNGVPGVVNMSLGGGISPTLDAAVQCLSGVGSGCSGNSLSVVVAAGNSNTDASLASPARVDEAITAGATTSLDQRSAFSNYGSAVDIFAPGSAIKAAWIGSATATRTISGTSMASPHVAGAAAVYLGINPSASPSQVLSALVSAATPNAISNVGPGSPNKLLFIGGLAIVTGISPNSGTSGTTITVTGENLDSRTGSTSVQIASLAATVTSESDGELQIQAPNASAGAADVLINNGLGTQTITNAFTYTAGSGTAPVIDAINPSAGPIAGGTTVTITGSNLTVSGQNTAVLFGSTPATLTSASGDELVVRAPSSAAGAIDVTVVTSEGQRTETSGYTFVAPPSISSLSSSSGPIAGGSTITLTGTNLALVSTVKVGDSLANFDDESSTSLTFTTPQRPLDSVNSYDIVVTSPGGSATVANGFTYVPAPSITSISSLGQLGISSSPLTGPAAGGTGVRILGTNLNEVTSVTFGGRAATFSRESSSSLTAISPSGGGLVDLVVSSPGGSDTFADAFEYDAPLVDSGGSSGGGSSGGSSSSSGGGSSAGGSQNEITAVTPVNFGTPGTVVAFTGWGLTTTRAVNFNDYPAEFSLVNDGHLEVTVPDIPPGVYVVHAVLAPEVGRASYWPGFSVLAPGSTPVAQVPSGVGETLPSKGTPQTVTGTSVDFVAFKGKSTKLTKATRTKIRKLTATNSGSEFRATVVGFTNQKETKKSVQRATKRAKRLANYLERAGFSGDVRTVTAPGSTKAQARGAFIMVEPIDRVDAESASKDQVSSLIVRLKKGRSPAVEGRLRGIDQLPAQLRPLLSLGPKLGLRMYRVNLSEPVRLQDAERIAVLLARDRGNAFVEPDYFAKGATESR